MERSKIKFCPCCAEPIEDHAVKCDGCGGILPQDANDEFSPRIYRNILSGWEWKSEIIVLDVPRIE